MKRSHPSKLPDLPQAFDICHRFCNCTHTSARENLSHLPLALLCVSTAMSQGHPSAGPVSVYQDIFCLFQLPLQCSEIPYPEIHSLSPNSDPFQSEERKMQPKAKLVIATMPL